MKNQIPFLLAAFVAANVSLAAEAVKPVCCAVDKPAAPCCVELPLVGPTALGTADLLSAHSIFQLDARWMDDAGATVQLAALRGKPVVLAMFFAQCEYACPVLVQDMQRLRAALPEALREKTEFVLVSFDTERDTPAALKAYRAKAALDARWTLLRGEPNAVQDLAMLLGAKFKQDARGQFAHSNLITILNAEGEIIHQKSGLKGDISQAAKAVMTASK